MTSSMTGYGRSQQTLNGRIISVELKSVNHRYFEFTARTPRGCAFMEDKLKTITSKKISRGKVDLFLNITSDTVAEASVRVNIPLAASYLDAIRELGRATLLDDNISLQSLSRFPDVFTVEKLNIDEEALWADVAKVAEEAVEKFSQMRCTEGQRLEEDLRSRLVTIFQLVGEVEQRSPQTVSDYRERLLQKITEVLADRSIDEGRLITEVAIFSERVAVDEETVRLKSHLRQFSDILSENQPVGRKLDFLTQEINREANTIGSKAQDAETAKVVVSLKSEIEKIREQIQNLE